MKKEKIKFHIENEKYSQGWNGLGNAPLSEPVPIYAKRAGDKIIQPDPSLGTGEVNNNTIIVMGRDRHPFGPNSKEDPNQDFTDSEESGYSTYMGAGAIDIIVGRGAPYAIDKKIYDKFPEKLLPHYTTRHDTDLKSNVTMSHGHPHLGFVLDAARIYISQMCKVDEYFKIKKQYSGFMDDKNPCSAIMLKADRIRAHSRRDIYLVAGGDPDTRLDSNGYPINDSGKIHLVAKNGVGTRGQTYAVRGDKLSKMMEDIIQYIQDIHQLINSFLLEQKAINHMFANEIYIGPFGPSTCNPINQAANQIKQVQDMAKLILVNASKVYNVPTLATTYLNQYHQDCIFSKYVTIT